MGSTLVEGLGMTPGGQQLLNAGRFTSGPPGSGGRPHGTSRPTPRQSRTVQGTGRFTSGPPKSGTLGMTGVTNRFQQAPMSRSGRGGNVDPKQPNLFVAVPQATGMELLRWGDVGMLPGDVYSGRADLNDPNTLNKAIAMGLMLAPEMQRIPMGGEHGFIPEPRRIFPSNPVTDVLPPAGGWPFSMGPEVRWRLPEEPVPEEDKKPLPNGRGFRAEVGVPAKQLATPVSTASRKPRAKKRQD
jgi:hypothetical protein